MARAADVVDARLDTYRTKRNFKKTPEPFEGAPSETGRLFVIQKHFATRLHFDLRLEIGGVLVSWAVTKGVSLNPKQRRLAVRTEDHPMSYGSFEGEIPKGQYGAGVVEIWDCGTYELLKDTDPSKGLAEGHLKFELKGERLRGGFALVRTKEEKGKELWLLIKEKDQAATTTFDPAETWVGSVGVVPGDPAKVLRPVFSKPQLATETERPPSGESWVHEIKYDGYRLQAVKDRSNVRLFTRSGQDWTVKLPTIREAVAGLPREKLVLDGELVVFNDDGNADFSALQRTLKTGAKNASFVAFDCLQIDNRDLKARSWAVRNGELRALLADASPPIRYCDYVTGDGREIFDAAVKLGAEGIVSKHIERPWRSGRNRSWLKSKGEQRGVFVVGGYRKSEARPFSSLLLGEPDGRRLIYRGRVGTGFSDKTLTQLSKQLDELTIDASPFVSVSDSARDAIWTRPELFVEVAYADESADGHLRHPKFLRVADGRPEASKRPAPVVKLTNADRVLYPTAGYTKGDLLDYYQAAAHHILPYLGDHYVSLVRAPSGKLDKTFFQRHEFNGMPDSIEVARRMGAYSRFLSINSEEGVVACAQFSVLEFHVWGAKREAIDRPDRLVFDLDPDETLPFATVRAAARLVRDVLEAGALTSYPLLTGGKGVHIVAPLNETAKWDKVSGFAEKLARQLAQAKSDLFVASATKSKRKGRIYLDWLRNKQKATAIAPWSPRARPGAPVAVPVSWDELSRTDRPDSYDLVRARRRMASLQRDPWVGYFDCDQTVPDL